MASRTFKLKDVCSVLSGFAFKSNFFSDAGMSLIRIRDVVRGFTETCYAGDYDEKYVVQNGEILIGMDGDFNLEYWEGGPALLNQRVCKITPDESILNKVFLYYFLPMKLKEIWEATPYVTVKHLSSKDVEGIEIPAWPLATQQHIARVLEQADQLRKQAQQMESELKQLAQSLFLEMFGDPVKNEKAWPQYSLAQTTTKIGSGSTPTGGKEAYQDIGISLIRSLNVHDGEFLYKNLARINDQQANALSNVVVEPQDVLLNITGASVCRCCVVPHDVLPARVNQHVAILRPDNVKLTTAYLQALIVSSSFKASLLQLAGAAGATREALTKGTLEALLIPTPPLDKQIEYGKAMNSLSMQINVIKRKQAQLNSLFESLMQRAFNGELTAPERKAA